MAGDRVASCPAIEINARLRCFWSAQANWLADVRRSRLSGESERPRFTPIRIILCWTITFVVSCRVHLIMALSPGRLPFKDSLMAHEEALTSPLIPADPKERFLILPFYRSPDLVQSVYESLLDCSEELNALAVCVIAINDSPEDLRLTSELEKYSARLRASCPVEILTPDTNLGFIGATNLGLAHALETGADAILLNSDTKVFPGSLSELCRVAEIDPMIGFVSPRSNNATICSLPQGEEFRHRDPAQSYRAFRSISWRLPRFQYAPTAVGFCLLIKHVILAELGLLDPVYGLGYNEENDLIMRANRVGFRAVIANHSFVYHQGEASFSATSVSKKIVEDENALKLTERYPEYAPNVGRYAQSIRYRAEGMLSAAVPASDGTYDLLFDCNHFGPYHNGTFEVAKKLLRSLAIECGDKFTVYVQANSEAADFHELRDIPGVLFLPANTLRTFAVGIRVGQPFEIDHLLTIGERCLCTIHVMQDSIAWDCLYLNRDHLELIWRSVFEAPNGVIYISDFTKDQFNRRFRKHPRLKEIVNYHSTRSSEYGVEGGPKSSGKKYILIVGNSFAHKFVEGTLAVLTQAFPDERFVALGIEKSAHRRVTSYGSGGLSEEFVNRLYADASLVIYPSFYEGFGLPIMNTLAHRKPVFVRNLPVSRSIQEQCAEGVNMYFYDTTAELVSALAGKRPVWRNATASEKDWTWAKAGRRMGEFAFELLQSTTVEDDMMPRLESLANLENRVRSQSVPITFVAPVAEKTVEAALLLTQLRLASDTGYAPSGGSSEYLKKRIEDLENSISWRVTAPLRALARPVLERNNKGKK